MALNPVLAKDDSTGKFFPMPFPSEHFILERKGIKLHAKTPTATMRGKGSFCLTSHRIVFIKDEKPTEGEDFFSFELPLALLTGEYSHDPQFKQPVFGANYLEGIVQPLISSQTPLSGTSKWSLTFVNGGCETFLFAFYKVLRQAKQAFEALSKQSASEYPPAATQLAQLLTLSAQASYVDPNDPSKIFVVQPKMAKHPTTGTSAPSAPMPQVAHPPQYTATPPPQYTATPPPQYTATPPPQYAGAPPPQYTATPPPQYAGARPPQYGSPLPQYGAPPQGHYTVLSPQPQYAVSPQPQYGAVPLLQFVPAPHPQYSGSNMYTGPPLPQYGVTTLPQHGNTRPPQHGTAPLHYGPAPEPSAPPAY